jgi:hypothetical protein
MNQHLSIEWEDCAVKRVLIDWDFAAHGIWIINSPSNEAPTQAEGHRGQWGNEPRHDSQRIRPWSDLLTVTLSDGLQRWNDLGCSLSRASLANQLNDSDWETFFRDGRLLAEAVQSELGDERQVLSAADGAWHFVRFP